MSMRFGVVIQVILVALVVGHFCTSMRRCAGAEVIQGTGELTDSMLVKLRAHYANSRTARLSLDSKVFVSSNHEQQRLAGHKRVDLVLDQDNKRTRVLKHPQEIPGKDFKQIRMGEQVYSSDYYLSVLRFPVTHEAETASSRMKVTDEDWQRFVSQSFFSVVFGYLPIADDYEHLLQILANIELAAEEHDLNGIPTIQFSGKSAEMLIQVWVDPKSEYMPRRIAFDPGVKNPRPYSILNYVYQVERVQDVNGHPFPASFTIIETRSTGNDERRILTTKVEVSSAALNQPIPESDFLISMPIANGTPVWMEDALQLSFAWKDGEIVPDPDRGPLLLPDGPDFSPASGSRSGSGSTRFWLITCNLILFVGLLLALLVRYIRKAV